MENKNTQTTNVFVRHQKSRSPKKKNDSFIRKIIIAVLGGLLVLWIWSQLNGNNNSNQDQMQKDREVLEKEKG